MMDGPALSDRAEIADTLALYTQAIDRREWERLALCFAPDAVGEYGRLGRLEGLDAIAQYTRSVLEPLDGSQHLLGSIEIALAGDRATSRSHFQAQHIRRKAEGGSLYLVAGSYDDAWTRGSEGWRIQQRTLVIRWQDGNLAVIAR